MHSCKSNLVPFSINLPLPSYNNKFRFTFRTKVTLSILVGGKLVGIIVLSVVVGIRVTKKLRKYRL